MRLTRARGARVAQDLLPWGVRRRTRHRLGHRNFVGDHI